MKITSMGALAIAIGFGPQVVNGAEQDLRRHEFLELRVTRLVVHHLPERGEKLPPFPTGKVPKEELHEFLTAYGRLGAISFRKYPAIHFKVGDKAKLDLAGAVPTSLSEGWAGVQAEYTVAAKQRELAVAGMYEQRVLVYKGEEIAVPAEKPNRKADPDVLKFINGFKAKEQDVPLRSRTAKIDVLLDFNSYHIQKTQGTSQEDSYVAIGIAPAKKRQPAKRQQKVGVVSLIGSEQDAAQNPGGS